MLHILLSFLLSVQKKTTKSVKWKYIYKVIVVQLNKS